MDNNQKGFKNLVLIGVVVIILAVGGYLVWKKNYVGGYIGYSTIEECEQKTGEQCLHDFGDSVVPFDSHKEDPVQVKKYQDCLNKVPSGWFPQSKAVTCTWPIK